MKKTNGLLIFAKAPVKGFVKTRLKVDTELSDDEILMLYKAFLSDVISAAMRTGTDRVYLSYHPEEGVSFEMLRCKVCRRYTDTCLMCSGSPNPVSTHLLYPTVSSLGGKESGTMLESSRDEAPSMLLPSLILSLCALATNTISGGLILIAVNRKLIESLENMANVLENCMYKTLFLHRNDVGNVRTSLIVAKSVN